MPMTGTEPNILKTNDDPTPLTISTSKIPKEYKSDRGENWPCITHSGAILPLKNAHQVHSK